MDPYVTKWQRRGIGNAGLLRIQAEMVELLKNVRRI
jgi:hypothetical protein